MIRTYTINELEELTGVNKRTISDYVNKGLLLGPSHRGRGAVYTQRDFYVLRIIPKLRALLKPEYGSLKAVAAFLTKLSVLDLQGLSARESERVFTAEARRLRLRSSLMGLMPHVSPEKFDERLNALTPEQICRVDEGQVQIGTVIDLKALLIREEQMAAAAAPAYPHESSSLEDTDELPHLSEALPAGQDLEEAYPGRPDAGDERENSDANRLISKKLDEIGNRLYRVEQMLDYDS